MSDALVTGGSGYFGARLVALLRDEGWRVRVLDLVDAEDRPGDVELVRGDVRDATTVRHAVAGCDVVFHNVAQVPLARDAATIRSVNVDGTAEVLDAALDLGVGKVVHTSSSAVFGIPHRNPVTPATVPAPVESYGAAKLAAERACRDAVRRGLDVTIVRPRTIVGHGRLGIFGILFDWIADGADPVVLGDGTNRYQFVHADDLAAACRAAALRSDPVVVHIGAAEFGTMGEALARLCDHAGTGSTVRRVPARPAAWAMRATSWLGLAPFAPYHWAMYARSMWFDIEPAVELLGWQPIWSTDAMLAQSYDHFVEHRGSAADDAASMHRRTAGQGLLRPAKRCTALLPPAHAQTPPVRSSPT